MGRAVIFDLDGTLADTSGDLLAAANACFEAAGLAVRLMPGADDGLAFRGGRAMLTEGFTRAGHGDAGAVDRWYPELLDFYGDNIDRFTTLYPGAVAALERLAGQGYALGVCTNKPRGLADRLLTRLRVRALFGSLVGADSLPLRKPHAAPLVAAVEGCGGRLARSCLVGDTETDRATARAAGVPSVLVTFGPDGERVRDLNPEALLTGYDALSAVVAGLEL